MKHKVFRNWVVVLLSSINILCVLFMASDFGSMFVFHLVHIIAFVIFIINTALIVEYGKNEWFE